MEIMGGWERACAVSSSLLTANCALNGAAPGPVTSAMDNEAAFDSVFRRYYGKILGFCACFIKGDRQAAEDCAQDVFAVLYERIGSLNNLDRIGAWLYKTADNLVKQRLAALARERKRLTRLSALREADAASALCYEDAFDGHRLEEARRAEEERLRAAESRILGSLKGEELDICRTVFRERQPISAVAASLSLSPAAAKSRVARLRHKIARLVRRFLDAAP